MSRANVVFAALVALAAAGGCTETLVACAADGSCPAGSHCVASVCEPGAAPTAADATGADGAADDSAAVDTPGGGAPCEPDLADGPSPRGDLAGGFVKGRFVVLFGDESVPVQCAPAFDAADDAWSFLPCGGWQALTGKVPPPRARAASATDHAKDLLYVYGGRHRSGTSGPYTVFGDLWRYDGTDWVQLHDGKNGPPGRSNTALAVRPTDGSLYLFGGNTSNNGLAFQPLDDTWRYDPAAGNWQKLVTTGTRPSPRLFHSAAITADGQYLVVNGGGGVNAFIGPFFSDSFRLDLETLQWEKIAAAGPVPLGRIKAGLVAIPGQKRLLFFGGHDDGPVGNRNDLWWLDAYDGTWEVARIGDLGKDGDPDVPNQQPLGVCNFPPEFTQLDQDAPERREAFLWDWDPQTQRVWLFGGKADCGPLRDVWTLDPQQASWQNVDDTPKGWSCLRYQSPCNTLCN